MLGMALMALFACNTAKQTASSGKKDPALLEFSQGLVRKSEFERVYAKNNGGPEAAARHTPEQYREYLDLYINFKRKVFEAVALGLDTTAAFEQEFNTYRKQLVQPYLSSREVEDRLVQEAYDRSGYLVNAAHILVSVSEDAPPADTLRAYQLAMAYRDSVLKGGKPFNYMAAQYSADPSARSNEGELGFFSVFDMVYPFENAAYTTEPGQISMPVRTRFGYHLVRVNEKVKNEGARRAAHIIVRVGDRYSAKTEDQARSKINEIYQRLKNGEDFTAMAAQYSDDPGSAAKGGDLGSGRLLPEMETIKMRLGKGEFSEPFQTSFGWHILKVTEVETLGSFEEAKPALKQKIARDSRSQLSRSALIAKIKRENAFSLDEASLAAFKATLNADFARGAWKPDSAQQALYARPLFSLGSSLTRSLSDFIAYYQSTRPRNQRLTAEQAADQFVNTYIEQQLLEYEEARLPEKNPEFRYLLEEYHDGILLFTLMEQKVWKRAVEDTAGLRAYYLAHQEEFEADEMVDVKEYRSDSEAAIIQVAALLAEGRTDAYIDSVINQTSALRLRITNQSYERGDAGLDASFFGKPAGYRSEPVAESGMHRIIEVQASYPAGIKPFDKARSECITRYQDYLEKQWLDELAAKYPVKVNEKTFERLYQ
jgi:peptidyl-prolyl cis-trans isomerase SurA